jgi:hypothetical protein
MSTVIKAVNALSKNCFGERYNADWPIQQEPKQPSYTTYNYVHC